MLDAWLFIQLNVEQIAITLRFYMGCLSVADKLYTGIQKERVVALAFPSGNLPSYFHDHMFPSSSYAFL